MGNSNDVPKEDPQIEIDTTNVGFVNMSESAVSTIGVGEILTIIVLVMIMGMIIKYCCKRMKVARRNELGETIRNAAMQVTAPPSASGFAPGFATQPQAGIPMVTFENPGQRRVQYTSQEAQRQLRGQKRGRGANKTPTGCSYGESTEAPN